MRSDSESTTRIFERLLIAAFCVYMMVPAIVMTRDGSLWSDTARSQVTSHDPLRRIAQYRAYFQKSFGLREALVRGYGQIQVKVFGVSSSDRVVLGKNDWLFYTAENELDCMRRCRPMRAEEVAAWSALLEARHAWLADQGIAYVFVVAPDKHTIYPENLPDSVVALHDESRLDQLMKSLADGRVPIIDLRTVLREGKRKRPTYLRTDTHYNDWGAYITYRSVIEAIRPACPTIRPLDETRVTMEEVALGGGDLADFLGIPTEYGETGPQMRYSPPLPITYLEPASYNPSSRLLTPRIVTASSAGEAESAMFYRDSFLNTPLPLLASHFQQATFLWQPHIDGAEVLRVRPKVIVQEMVERQLMLAPPTDVNVPYAAPLSPAARP